MGLQINLDLHKKFNILVSASASGPSSFSTWALSSIPAIICWRISIDCFVLLLIIGLCIWAILGFSSASDQPIYYFLLHQNCSGIFKKKKFEKENDFFIGGKYCKK